jgi:hypothetical protein
MARARERKNRGPHRRPADPARRRTTRPSAAAGYNFLARARIVHGGRHTVAFALAAAAPPTRKRPTSGRPPCGCPATAVLATVSVTRLGPPWWSIIRAEWPPWFARGSPRGSSEKNPCTPRWFGESDCLTLSWRPYPACLDGEAVGQAKPGAGRRTDLAPSAATGGRRSASWISSRTEGRRSSRSLSNRPPTTRG